MPDLRQPPNITGQRMITNARPVKPHTYRGDGTDQLQDEYLRVPLEKPRPEHRQGKHGTYAGYKVHLRAKEKPCPPCAEASRRATNERRARKRANK